MPRSIDKKAGRQFADRIFVRAATRTLSVGFLAATISYGLMTGGHLDDPRNPLFGVPEAVADYLGYAAGDIRITGLDKQPAEYVLKAIGVEPGGALFGFNARRAKKLLENTDWVERADLRVVHPNKLVIEIVERAPFAVWQRGSSRYVIDRNGIALSTLDAADYSDLLVVTGEGAQAQVSQLVNYMEGHPAVESRMKAAARVGQRRWTLYLGNGLRVVLPENDVEAALDRLDELVQSQGILERSVSLVDLRFDDRTILVPLPIPETDDKVKVSAM